MSYFSNFPKIDYFNSKSRNIILRAALISDVFNKSNVFYKYIVPEGYRPDHVAQEVYGNPNLDWVIFFSNNIIDPYYDWPLDQYNFKSYLEKKYSKTMYELQNTEKHYKYTGIGGETEQDIARKSWIMTVDTYNALSAEERSGWSLVSVYDYETELNDSKRSLNLLSYSYLPQIINELSKTFNQ
jgi:hypothetical protein